MQINDWFDIFNTSEEITDGKCRNRAYGLDMTTHTEILSRMTATAESMRVKGRRSMLPFQSGKTCKLLICHILTIEYFTGIVMASNALQLLFPDLTLGAYTGSKWPEV